MLCLFVAILLLPIGHSYEFKVNFVNKVQEFLKNGNSEISTQCEQQIQLYLQALILKETWALRMYDASVKTPPSGILDGNFYDLGSFDECINIEYLNNATNISGKYCIGTTVNFYPTKSENVTVKLPDTLSSVSEWLVPKSEMHVAKCFPSACSAKEMREIYTANDFDISFDDTSCQTKKDWPKFDTGSIATISVFGVILWVVVFSTAYDVVLYYLRKKPYHIILISFSLMTNGRSLLKVNCNSNEISCLHGLRTISIMWIILYHRYCLQFQLPKRNYFYDFEWYNSEKNMFILQANIAVDTFLLLSGLLISYNFMRTTTKGIKFNILLQYIHRYLRLTPVLTVVMVSYLYLLIHIGSGPLWPTVIQNKLVNPCELNWWRALLYIQNIFTRTPCMFHTWYLSVDMQLYIASPLLIFPLKKWPKLGLLIIGSLTVTSMVACFLIGWFYELNAIVDGNSLYGFDKLRDFVDLYYIPPHTRAASWLIGIILGYLMFENKEGRLRLTKNKLIVLVLWMNALVVLCLCVVSGHRLITGKNKRLANSFHIALVRPVWAIAIGWVIFACINELAGRINWFLSLPIFQVISKLSYTLYMVHPAVLHVVTAQMRVVPLLNDLEIMYAFWGDFAYSLLVSVILTLTVEFPMITIDKCIFGRAEKKEN